MPIPTSLGRRWFARRLRRKIARLHGASSFEQTFKDERSRSDRSGLPLSLVVFRGAEKTSAHFPYLARLLERRTRATDSFGVLHSGVLAALLPDTPQQGARAFSADVLRILDLPEGSILCDHYCYPEDGQSEGARRHGDRSREKAAPAAAATQATPSPENVAAAEEATHGAGHETSASETDGTGRRENDRARPGSHEETADTWHFGGTMPLAEFDRLALHRLSWRKRGFDILVSGGALLVASPLFAAVAAAIKLNSRGPVFFSQPRAGRGGVPFRFYKFRSMRTDAERIKEELRGAQSGEGEGGEVIFKMRRDPRVTSVGRFLRKWSIDELPQLWNVFKGDMTLIGPRPPTLDEVTKYDPWQRHRLNAPVGLICIREVTGRSELSFEEWVRSDLRYLRQRSMRFDLKLMLRSVYAVLSCRGAY